MGYMKTKKTMRSMVVVFYLQDWNKGINDPPNGGELPPRYKNEAKTEVKTEVKFK